MSILQLTPIAFGKNSLNYLAPFVQGKYQKALLVTGKKSIKANGLYQELKTQLLKAHIELVDFFGIKPNPTNQQVNEAIKLGIHQKVDLIIGAGGGSAIDAAKVIAAGISNNLEDSWDLVTQKAQITHQPLDVIAIITLAGTASENNAGSVLTNEALQEKRGTRTRAPILCIADPQYTTSVSRFQTASGIFDAFSHLLEQYNSLETSFAWTDNYNYANFKTLLDWGKIVVNDLQNYQARANILFTCSMALNGLASFQMPHGDWNIHALAHGIAAIFDTTHGATLALVTPAYLTYRAKHEAVFAKRLETLGQNLFNVNTYQACIAEIQKFIIHLALPTKWSDLLPNQKIDAPIIENIAQAVKPNLSINHKQIRNILNLINR